MKTTNINIDGIEKALPDAYSNLRYRLIQGGLKQVNIWLTPNSNAVEIINILVYDYHGETKKFPVDMGEQFELLVKMFDDSRSLVHISKTKEVVIKTFFNTNHEFVTSEERQHVFTLTAQELKREMEIITDILSALRNPRVVLSIDDHRNLKQKLNRFNIDLNNYYI